MPFEIDPEIERRLLNGLDDIGVTLQQADAIDRYEASASAAARSPPRCDDRATGTPRPTTASSTPQVGVGAGGARPARSCAATRPCSTPAAAAAGSREMLLERLPARPGDRGRRRALDGRAGARALLGDRAEVLLQAPAELELDEPVDAVFSNAVFHWIPDHDAPVRAPARRAASPAAGWSRSAAAPGTSSASTERPREVAARAAVRELPRRLGRARGTSRRPSRPRSASSAPASTDVELLARATGRSCPTEPRDYMRTVCLGHHLEQLPEELRDDLVGGGGGRAAATRWSSTTCA